MTRPRTTPREHGTRARYCFGPYGNNRAAGCRCDPCRQANNAYARYSAKRVRLNRTTGAWARPYVDSARARHHIDTLRRQGVGGRRVAELAGINRKQIHQVLTGGRIRLQTEAAILSVQPEPAGGALVDAAPTWQLIGQLLAAGVTKKRIGQAVTANPAALALQLRTDRITARAAQRVAALHHQLLAPVAAPYRCTCGLDLASLDAWRAHNDSLNGRFAGHRLQVTTAEAAG